MFKEALQAPVYVADLTGSNANVYLELGVRWSLRDHVTVLVCQDVAQDVKFNVAPNRVIPYGRGSSELEAARRDIVRAIAHGIKNNQVDSPVRDGLGLISVSRAEVDQLRVELAKLRQERGDEPVAAAKNGKNPEWDKKPTRIGIVAGRGSNISRWITYFISAAKPRKWLYPLVALGLSSLVALALVLISWPSQPHLPNPIPSMSPSAPVPCAFKAKPPGGVLAFGTLLPMSGSFHYAGPAREAAVQLAIDDIKSAEGIPNINITLDDPNKLDEGNPATDNVVSASVDALLPRVGVIVGPATSQAARNVISKVTCSGTIMFSPSVTSSSFTTMSSSLHGLFFRTAPSSELEGRALGDLIAEDRNSTVVVVSRDDDYGNSLRNETTHAITALGLPVLDSFSYDPNASDYRKYVQRIRQSRADAIVVIGFRETADVLGEMIKEDLGPKSGKRVYVSGASMTTTLARNVNPHDPNVLAGVKGTPLAEDMAFETRLKEAHPDIKNFGYSAQAYDAVVITTLAAAVAGTDAPSAIAKEINNITRTGEKECRTFTECMKLVSIKQKFTYVGPSGPLNFTDAGEPRSGTYAISEIRDNGTVNIIKNVTINR